MVSFILQSDICALLKGPVYTCRGSATAAQSKSALAAVFDVAPNCVDAKLLQAEVMLDEKDYGGVQSAETLIKLVTEK